MFTNWRRYVGYTRGHLHERIDGHKQKSEKQKLKNLCSFVITLICWDYRNQLKSSHYLFIFPWEWCHDDAEMSAFNVNIRLLMF